MTETLGGSATSTAAAISILYYLSKDLEVQEKLSKELDTALDHQPLPYYSYSAVAKTPYLDAVINEALRLMPPGATGPGRVTSAEGLIIDRANNNGETLVIPGDTVVSVQVWSMHRDPRYFSHPEIFSPERWLSTTEPSSPSTPSVLEPRAFLPFSIGPRRCAGQALAYLELRVLISKIVKSFKFKLVPGPGEKNAAGSRSDWDWESKSKDTIALEPADAWAAFEQR